ncbi:MAG: type I-E CRISPR-associated protein Cse1/CasA [Aquabacterium sp.]|nr:type I-E CRISPR-associated protein Cse1/CasA [Aquabacterium sp.]
MPTFNLIDEPWVPVRFHDGSTEELGLLALFVRAQEIEGLAENSPPNLVALHRILLAILHRALTRQLGRWTDRDRAHWFANGLPAGAVADYLAHWRDRFWLFHPVHPFMQVAALAAADETRDKRKPWTQVSLASANGNTPVVFDHAIDSQPSAIAAATAVRHLLGFLQFTPGGLVKVFRSADKGGPLANAAAAVPMGESLLQTLLLALHPAVRDVEHDQPAWEKPAITLPQLFAEPSPAAGSSDRYSRISRAVLLERVDSAEPASVRWLRFGAGLALADDGNAPDPMTSLRPGSDGLVRMGFTEGRATWRDLGALLPDPTGKLAQPASVLSWATNLQAASNQEDADMPVMLAGLCSDKAKLLRWRTERYQLPHTSLCSADLSAAVRDQLQRCDTLFASLRTLATELLALSMPDPRSKDTRARARAVLDAGPFNTTYFASAERRLPQLLKLVGAADLDAAHAAWSATLADAATQAWAAVRGMLGTSAAALRADAITHGRFLALTRALRPTIDTPPQAEEATT